VKNRERLLKMSLCDMLFEISKPMLAYSCDCIMEALVDDTPERCRKHEGKCRDCIAEWLGEEEHQ
jgi:hypothetical protein